MSSPSSFPISPFSFDHIDLNPFFPSELWTLKLFVQLVLHHVLLVKPNIFPSCDQDGSFCVASSPLSLFPSWSPWLLLACRERRWQHSLLCGMIGFPSFNQEEDITPIGKDFLICKLWCLWLDLFPEILSFFLRVWFLNHIAFGGPEDEVFCFTCCRHRLL